MTRMHIQAINTARKEMAEQITTKELIFRIKPDEMLDNGMGL